MASPARRAREYILANLPNGAVIERGKGHIKMYDPVLNRAALRTGVGGRGYHYGPQPYTEASEVDTAWIASAGAWDYEVVKNDFHSFVRDSVPVSYRYFDPTTGHYVELIATDLLWVNAEGQGQNAATFSQVTPVITDDILRWNDIAPGWDVEVQAQPYRLIKWLHIESLAALGSPTIGGTNIRLRMRFTITRSSNLQVWVNGIRWLEANNTFVETSGDMEFRDVASGQVVFYLEHPAGADAMGEIAPMTQRMRRTGGTIRTEIDTPWTWLQAATFPIRLDDSINPAVGASADDAEEASTGAVDIDNTPLQNTDQANEWSGFRFTGITIGSVSAWTSAKLTCYFPTGTLDEPQTTIYGLDTSAPAAFAATTNNISGRSRTTASVNWESADLGAPGNFDSPDITTIIDELYDSYGPYSSGVMGFVITSQGLDAARDSQIDSYDGGNPADLYIEWTPAGGETYYQTVSGGITSSGTVVNRVGKIVSGALTSLGTLVNRTGKIVSGALTSAGALVIQTRKVLVGELTSSGVLSAVKTAFISLDGELTSAGTLILQTAKNLIGELTSSGALSNIISKILSGALAPDGALSRLTSKILVGELTSSGVLTAVKTALISLAGELTPAGELVRSTFKVLSGSITPDGALSRLVSKILDGAFTPAGEIIRSARKVLDGALTSAGTLATEFISGVVSVTVEGVLTPVGELIKRTSKSMAGALVPAGELVAYLVGAVTQAVEGVLTPAGELIKRTSKSLAGGLAPAGTLVAKLVGYVIEEALYLYLSTDAGVSALVSNRIYPLFIPQDVALPAVAYQKISSPRMTKHPTATGAASSSGGALGVARARFQLTVMAETVSEAENLAEAIRLALDGYRGTWSGVDIYSCFITNEMGGYTPSAGRQVVRMDAMVLHDEN